MRLLVDAEHTYFQPAIDALTINMQQKYNVVEPVVINTYQCYLKDAYQRLSTDMQVISESKSGDNYAVLQFASRYSMHDRPYQHWNSIHDSIAVHFKAKMSGCGWRTPILFIAIVCQHVFMQEGYNMRRTWGAYRRGREMRVGRLG